MKWIIKVRAFVEYTENHWGWCTREEVIDDENLLEALKQVKETLWSEPSVVKLNEIGIHSNPLELVSAHQIGVWKTIHLLDSKMEET